MLTSLTLPSWPRNDIGTTSQPSNAIVFLFINPVSFFKLKNPLIRFPSFASPHPRSTHICVVLSFYSSLYFIIKINNQKNLFLFPWTMLAFFLVLLHSAFSLDKMDKPTYCCLGLAFLLRPGCYPLSLTVRTTFAFLFSEAPAAWASSVGTPSHVTFPFSDPHLHSAPSLCATVTETLSK